MKLTSLLITLFLTSLVSANVFVEAGAPSLDKPWSGDDYLGLSAVLREKKLGPPMLADADGAALLAKLTDENNLKLLAKKEVSLKARLSDGESMGLVASSLLLDYEKMKREKDEGHSEAAMVSAFILRLSALPLDLLAEHPDDRRLVTRKDSIIAGFAQCLRGAAFQLAGAPLYTEEALLEVIEAVRDVSLAHGKALDQEQRKDVVSGLEISSVVIPEKWKPLIELTVSELSGD